MISYILTQQLILKDNITHKSAGIDIAIVLVIYL